MKKIGIDARLYFQTGVGVYLRNLLHYLQKMEKNLIFHIYVLEKDSSKIKFENKNFLKVEVKSMWHSMNEQVEFLNIIKKDNLDLIHFTYFGHPILYQRNFIVTIHDLTPLFFKTGVSTRNFLVYRAKYLAFKNLVLANQVRNSKAIITPTKSVRENLIQYYGENYANKIQTIYEGVNYELFSAKENQKLSKEFNNFLLYTGNFYPHKNTEILIRAFAKVKSKVDLVMVGPDGYFAAQMKKLVKDLGQEKRILFHHNPTTEDFVFFYKNAKALVHPSLSEGFGLPIVESMYFNLPIIASNIDIFREILGDKYLEFNPKDMDDIKNKIEYFLDKKPKADYGNLLNKYSFEKMAKETLEVYKKSIIKS